MLCQRCNDRESTIHYTKIINGEIEELHLCDECAMDNEEMEFDPTFSFHKLLTGLIDSVQEGQVKSEREEDLTCSFCGLTYSEFKRRGKFGCSNCYETFEKNLYPLLKGIHGGSEHIGKVPSRANKNIIRRKKIMELRNQLEKLVSEEAFEEAAVLRDKINELEEDLHA